MVHLILCRLSRRPPNRGPSLHSKIDFTQAPELSKPYRNEEILYELEGDRIGII